MTERPRTYRKNPAVYRDRNPCVAASQPAGRGQIIQPSDRAVADQPKLRVDLGFVSEAGGAEDLGFEGEFDPFPCPLALHDHLAALVERDVAVGQPDRAGGVGDGEGFVPLGPQLQKEALLLGGIEREGVGGAFGGHAGSHAHGGRVCHPKSGPKRWLQGRKRPFFFPFRQLTKICICWYVVRIWSYPGTGFNAFNQEMRHAY